MRVATSLSLGAAMMAGVIDAVAIIPSCNGGSYSTTSTVMHRTVASTTTTTTIRPTTLTTSTSTITVFATKTNFKMTTSTKVATSYITRFFPITTTTVVTSTDTDDAVTITPATVTSTISSIAGFTPASSALVTPDANSPVIGKRAAIGSLCSVNVYKATRTVTMTASVTRGAAVTQTVTRSTTSTSTRVVNMGGVTIINTVKTATTILPTARTKTSTLVIIPTSTAAAPVLNFYQACVDANLLSLTNVLATATDDDSSSNVVAAPASVVTNTDPLVAAAVPSPGSRVMADATQVGINSIFAGANMMVVASTADDAASCCAMCQGYNNCAGSYFSSWYGTCNLVVADSCPDQSASAGQFYYDDNMQLTTGSGLTVSNGNCGQWAYGGVNDALDSTTSS